MLLHTVEWWPEESKKSLRTGRFATLFPAASLATSVRILVSARQWGLCRRLFDHVLYRELMLDHITREEAMVLITSAARLVAHRWPASGVEQLESALTAAVLYACEREGYPGALVTAQCSISAALGECDPAEIPGDQRAAAQAVVAVLNAAFAARSYSELATFGGQVVAWAGRAAAQSARPQIWKMAFLFLEVFSRRFIPGDPATVR